MNAESLVDEGDGAFSVHGDMTFDTVGKLLYASRKAFEPHSRLSLNLSAVENTDSAGLALLIEWITWANRTVREISFDEIPERIESIAEISEVSEMLHVGERWSGFI